RRPKQWNEARKSRAEHGCGLLSQKAETVQATEIASMDRNCCLDIRGSSPDFLALERQNISGKKPETVLHLEMRLNNQAGGSAVPATGTAPYPVEETMRCPNRNAPNPSHRRSTTPKWNAS